MAPTTFPVTVHEFLPAPDSKKLTHVYEYGIHSYTSPIAEAESDAKPKSNALVFIGGLGDGPHGVPYIRHIVSALSSASPSSSSTSAEPSQSSDNVKLSSPWSVFEVRLSSAYSGWGISSLAQDVDEIAAVVRYLRSTLNKHLVVLMGHSTGCQDCVAYLHRWDRIQWRREMREEEGAAASEQAEHEEDDLPEIDAIILQGPVSDRHAIAMNMPRDEMEEARSLASEMIYAGKKNEYMPKDKLPVDMRDTPVTAYRFYSLAGVQGDDDFFSSDLGDTMTGNVWNPLRKPTLIVPSGEDEFVPQPVEVRSGYKEYFTKTVDVEDLMQYWRPFCRPGVYSDLSGLIPGANHRVDNAEGREWLADRVLRFLAQVEGGIEIGVIE